MKKQSPPASTVVKKSGNGNGAMASSPHSRRLQAETLQTRGETGAARAARARAEALLAQGAA